WLHITWSCKRNIETVCSDRTRKNRTRINLLRDGRLSDIRSSLIINVESTMDMEKLVALCRRRGFIFQSSEIYGGINGFWDYGPLGVELKKNIKDAWWNDMVRNPPPGPDGHEISMVGVDCSIIMNPKVWEASGHVGGFADPMVDCRACRTRFRAD